MKCWFPRGIKTTTCTSFSHIEFFSLTSWHCVHQRWNLQISWCCYYWPNICRSISLILHNSRIRYFWCGPSQNFFLLWLTPHQSMPSSSNWNIWVFTQICRCIFTWLCQCYLEFKRVRGRSLFCIDYFSSWKNFNYVAKDINIFHLKSSIGCKPIYFLTSTPSGHTPHCHN